MLRSTSKLPLTLIALLSLSGCSSIPSVSNPAPRPYFLSCATVNYLARCEAPMGALQDAVGTTNVMLKLNEQEPEDERDKFIHCELAIPECPGPRKVVSR